MNKKVQSLVFGCKGTKKYSINQTFCEFLLNLDNFLLSILS